MHGRDHRGHGESELETQGHVDQDPEQRKDEREAAVFDQLFPDLRAHELDLTHLDGCVCVSFFRASSTRLLISALCMPACGGMRTITPLALPTCCTIAASKPAAVSCLRTSPRSTTRS